MLLIRCFMKIRRHIISCEYNLNNTNVFNNKKNRLNKFCIAQIIVYRVGLIRSKLD